MKISLDGVEYTVKPLPLYLMPHAARLANLLQKTPEDAAEADKIGGEIKLLMEKILKETVSPAPAEAYTIQLFNAVSKCTEEVMKQAGLFRNQKFNIEESSAVSDNNT